MLEIIPVLDLMNSVAVSGKSGNRDTYTPLQTIYASSSDPVEIANSLKRANAKEMYIGLEPDLALDVFDYETCGEEAVQTGRCYPKVISQTDSCQIEELISYDDTPCFAVQRYTIASGEQTLTHAPAVYVVTEGEGTVVCNGQSDSVKKGDYFFLPYAAKEKTILQTDSKLQVVVSLPPRLQAKSVGI